MASHKTVKVTMTSLESLRRTVETYYVAGSDFDLGTARRISFRPGVSDNGVP